MDPSADAVFGDYPTRCLLGLVASLALLIALAHLPVRRASPQVGWRADASADRIVLSDIGSDDPSEAASNDAPEHAPPPTAAPPSPEPEPRSPSDAPSEDGAASPNDSEPEENEVRYAHTLDVTDRTPQIVGGKGSLYLNIAYPEEARAQGIEGRLMLEFLVESDGSVTDVEVAKSLHPLCDSSAVEGVRSVEFIPAKVNGDPVPVRLRLPVRFEISSPATTARTPSNGP